MPVKSRNLRKKRKCPLGFWGIFTDRPLPESHPEYNKFHIFLGPSDLAEHKEEVLKYWIEKKVPRGTAKAVFLRREGLLTDEELKMIKGNYQTRLKNG